MKTTLSRIDHIKQARIKRDNIKKDFDAKMEAIRIDLINKIENILASRIKDIFIVGQELVHSGFDICDFETDGWSHKLGFYIEESENKTETITHIGIENGGALGSINLRINQNGEIIEGERLINSLERFINGFDDFESRFYNYVDNL